MKQLQEGTVISRGTKIDPEIPCFIVKRNLSLLKLSSLDFSFIVEDNISDIFQILHENKMKVDLIQNSAISFSVCVYDKYYRLKELLSILKATYKVECTENISLFTIRHFNENSRYQSFLELLLILLVMIFPSQEKLAHQALERDNIMQIYNI